MTVYITEGSGPPIVLIAQLGCGGDIWQPVVGRLHGLNAVTYDRPGTGTVPARAAPNPPLPPSAFADELASMLDNGGIAAPLVIVGHSFGGLIARQFAGRQPHQVAGLVLVDCSIPPMHLHPSTRQIRDGDGLDATEVDTVRGHVEAIEAVMPDVPAVVVSRTHGRWDGENPPPHPAVEDLWRAYQSRYADELGCPLLVAENSSHQVQRDAPDLIVYALRVVHAAVREGKPINVDPDEVMKAGGHVDRRRRLQVGDNRLNLLGE